MTRKGREGLSTCVCCSVMLVIGGERGGGMCAQDIAVLAKGKEEGCRVVCVVELGQVEGYAPFFGQGHKRRQNYTPQGEGGKFVCNCRIQRC